MFLVSFLVAVPSGRISFRASKSTQNMFKYRGFCQALAGLETDSFLDKHLISFAGDCQDHYPRDDGRLLKINAFLKIVKRKV